MLRVVIGTAGHVDHGKTALVKALTGIDTDRLAEERRRGITIELGFAHLALPGGEVAGVVDVPGHERFVRSMAAGAGGLDLVILVVAADEGIMPQTREHLDICRLLGVRRGLVAITKSDLLPGLGSEWLPLLLGELKGALAGTFLEGAPVLPCSTRTGEGLPALREALGTLAATVAPRPADGPLLLPIDRSFTLKGFGTVVTGTLLSGSITEGEQLALLPSPPGQAPLRVRTLQVHGAAVKKALAGQRTAVNLPGLEAGEAWRGQALARPGELPPSSLLDAEVTLLPAATRALRHRARLLLHLGTAQVQASVSLQDRGELAPGATALAQLRLAEPVAALPGQRFILRGFAKLDGRGATLAGGRVLSVAAPRRRRGRAESLAQLAVLAGDAVEPRLAAVLAMAGPAGLDALALGGRVALSPRALEEALGRLSARRQALLVDRTTRTWVAGAVAEQLSARLLAGLTTHHRAHPREAGMGLEALRGLLPPVADARLFQRLLVQLGEAGAVAIDGELVRRAEHRVVAGAAGDALAGRVCEVLRRGGLTPPLLSELPAACAGAPAELAAALKQLLAEGRVVRVSADLHYDAGMLDGLRERLVAWLRQRPQITTQEFKELVGASRKHVIPLAEYFDRERVTLRVGDHRVLRGQGSP
jgi:selenocysteine-specific elongation factor